MSTSRPTSPFLILNLKKPESLSFSVPLSFRFYRHSKTKVETWKELYGGVMRFLCQKNSSLITKDVLDNSPLLGDIGDLKSSKTMKNPYFIKRGLYLETGISTDIMIRKIRNAMQYCGMDLTYLQIEYYIDEERKKAFVAQRKKAADAPKSLRLLFHWSMPMEQFVLVWDMKIHWKKLILLPLLYRKY